MTYESLAAQNAPGNHGPSNPAAVVTIHPTSNVMTLNSGDTFHETITVTIPKHVATGVMVTLAPSHSIATFIASITPATGHGPLSAETEHVLKFEVVFHGIPCREEEQVVTGTIDVLVRDRVAASKRVQITVPACPPKTVRYSVPFACGTQPEECGCAPVRPGRYATHVSIHNYSEGTVEIRKRFIPVVLAGAATGREPTVATPRADDAIRLPPHTATMDDCCRISQLLFGGITSAITVGVMEVLASHDVAVTAVYTKGSSMDIELIPGRAL